MKIVDVLIIFSRGCGSNEIIDPILFFMVSELSAKAHQRSIFMIDGSNECPFACARNAELGRIYSVWVEGMPV
jgi:thioredoxin-related protein